MGRRQLVVVRPGDEGDEEFVTITTGGPKKVYRHRQVRRTFVNQPIYDYPPIESALLKQIASEVRMARYRHQLSQANLAKLAKTSQSEISLLELAKSNPTVELLERVARVLGLKITANIKW